MLCVQSVGLMLFGLPAAASAILLLSRFGVRWLSIWGFVLLAVAFAALAVAYLLDASAAVKFSLYCVLTCALNWGPNVSTYVAPASAFPTRVRGLFHGLSAASGKLGAVVGSFIFLPVSQAAGIGAVLWLQVALMVGGLALSIFFLPAAEEAAASARQRRVSQDLRHASANASPSKGLN